MENKELYLALSKAQGEFPVIPKDSEVKVMAKDNPNRLLYKYKYADLTTIINCTRPALTKHGLSFTQSYNKDEGVFFTRFMHESGGILDTGFIPCSFQPNLDMKSVAGMVTYVKRISLTAALGVSADEDVDAAHDEAVLGNSSTRVQQGPKPSQVSRPAPPADIDEYLEKDPPLLPPHSGPLKPTNPNEPSSYVIPFGKWKGKTLAQVGVHEAKKTIEYFQKLNKDSGKGASATMKQFERMLSLYVDELELTNDKEGPPGPIFDEPLPEF